VDVRHRVAGTRPARPKKKSGVTGLALVARRSMTAEEGLRLLQELGAGGVMGDGCRVMV